MIPLDSDLRPVIEDPMRYLREDTVTKLWRHVQQYHIVHVPRHQAAVINFVSSSVAAD